MEQKISLKDSQIVILGILICVATIASSSIFSQGFLKVKKFNAEVINVTGSAEKKIISDSIYWRLSFSTRNPVMTEAYRELDEHRKLVEEYLLKKGITSAEMGLESVITETLYVKNEKGTDTNQIDFYRLTQGIQVNSGDVLKVAEISAHVTDLINQGVALSSNSPSYFYTRLSDLKVEMLKQAAQDARKRAKEIASSSGNKIGAVRSAKMGVFQITPANSYEVSDWGTNDTSSYEKKVTAVVKADFAIS